MDTTDVAVLAERRAKMAKLRSEHFVADRDVTSAPHITRYCLLIGQFMSILSSHWSININTVFSLVDNSNAVI